MKNIETADYQIAFGDASEGLENWLSKNKYSSHFALIDEQVYQLHSAKIDDWCKRFSIKKMLLSVGEKLKSIRSCEKIWAWLMSEKADRQSLVLNIGGGIVGDMGGFAAATFKRGVAFIQIPTTLLSQVDASIGGKLAVNFGGIKNNIGVFRHPETILIDTSFYQTLSDRELTSGFAEVIKHALIADVDLWEKLKRIEDLRAVDWNALLPQAIEVKNKIVAIDPFEKKERKSLNFGHTVGHALESTFVKTKSPMLHGEAVAAGMICESWMSHQIAGLSKNELDEITDFMQRFFTKKVIQKRHLEKIHGFVFHDKKNVGGKVSYTLLPNIGHFSVDNFCKEELLSGSLDFYKNFYSSFSATTIY